MERLKADLHTHTADDPHDRLNYSAEMLIDTVAAAGVRVLAITCHEKFQLLSIPGYLENGLPPKYGYGAEAVVQAVHRNPAAKHGWVTDLLGAGDIDRAIIEWRSLLRQISHAPELDWPRWRALQTLAKTILNETESPTLTDLPRLEFNQTRRVDHRLILRRH